MFITRFYDNSICRQSLTAGSEAGPGMSMSSIACWYEFSNSDKHAKNLKVKSCNNDLNKFRIESIIFIDVHVLEELRKNWTKVISKKVHHFLFDYLKRIDKNKTKNLKRKLLPFLLISFFTIRLEFDSQNGSFVMDIKKFENSLQGLESIYKPCKVFQMNL